MFHRQLRLLARTSFSLDSSLRSLIGSPHADGTAVIRALVPGIKLFEPPAHMRDAFVNAAEVRNTFELSAFEPRRVAGAACFRPHLQR